MESIGDLAQRTGTSRRMLRHWEAQGILEPADVDPWTKQRRYTPSQAGRVRAIAALRSVGFSLDAIRDLLDQGLNESRLLELLRERQSELAERIAQDTKAMKQVQARLRALAKGRTMIASSLTLCSLPELRGSGLSESVGDESEIHDAVQRLLRALNVAEVQSSQTVTLIYDGVSDASVIRVSALLPEDAPGVATGKLILPAIGRAGVVRLEARPDNTADAWIALDAELEVRGMRATGPYRQTLHIDGTVTLASPVVPLSECSEAVSFGV